MIHNSCIYTIKHSDDINEILSSTRAGTFREYRNWKGAKLLLDESKIINNKLIILFSPAESTTYLHSWAYIHDINISEDNNFTDYSFTNLTRLNIKFKKSSLILLSNNKHIDANFIRPYALCETPSKLFNNNQGTVVESLESYVETSNINDSDNILLLINEKMKKIKPEKVESLINRSIRNDSQIIKLLKRRYCYRCQFPGCNAQIKMKNGSNYVEVAHIRPVSKGGKSIIGNLLVLCPNHHKEFDLGNLIIKSQTDDILEGSLNDNSFIIKLQKHGA